MRVYGDWLAMGASLKWPFEELQFLALLGSSHCIVFCCVKVPISCSALQTTHDSFVMSRVQPTHTNGTLSITLLIKIAFYVFNSTSQWHLEVTGSQCGEGRFSVMCQKHFVLTVVWLLDFWTIWSGSIAQLFRQVNKPLQNLCSNFEDICQLITTALFS